MCDINKVINTIRQYKGKVYKNKYSGLIHWVNFDNKKTVICFRCYK